MQALIGGLLAASMPFITAYLLHTQIGKVILSVFGVIAIISGAIILIFVISAWIQIRAERYELEAKDM